MVLRDGVRNLNLQVHLVTGASGGPCDGAGVPAARQVWRSGKEGARLLSQAARSVGGTDDRDRCERGVVLHHADASRPPGTSRTWMRRSSAHWREARSSSCLSEHSSGVIASGWVLDPSGHVWTGAARAEEAT